MLSLVISFSPQKKLTVSAIPKTYSFLFYFIFARIAFIDVDGYLNLELESKYHFYVGGLPSQPHNPKVEDQWTALRPTPPVNSLNDTISYYRAT
jgi:hypothetical protein